MTGSRLLALDLGTTGVRALLVDGEGKTLARAYRPLATRFPKPGRVEQDPEEMWQRSVEVLREALSHAGAEDIAALGVVTQRATTVAWDAASGAVLCPALGWQDKRTEPRAEELHKMGIPITTLPSATRFEWWLRHEPAVQQAAREGRLCFGGPDAWLTFRLTGGAANVTDPSQASCTGFYDLRAGRWNPDILAFFSVEEQTLPSVVPTASVVGETPRELLGSALPVAARAGDQQAATFAQGALAAGEAKLTLGTAAMLDLNVGDTPVFPGPGLFPLALWRLGGCDAFCLEASVITAGAVVDWLVALGLLPEATAFDRVAGQVASAEGVAFVPALQGLGTPYFDDGARGLLGGLTRGSTAAHVVRAVLEGLAHRCVDLCDALELEREQPLRVDGGLARSDLLLQRLADLSGRPVLRAAETETTALGAAFMAGLGAGIYDDVSRCAELAAPPRRFEPAAEPDRREQERRRWHSVVDRARAQGAAAAVR